MDVRQGDWLAEIRDHERRVENLARALADAEHTGGASDEASERAAWIRAEILKRRIRIALLGSRLGASAHHRR